MNTLEEVKKIVLRAFNEYKDYVELAGEKNEVKRKHLEDIKKSFKDDGVTLEIKDFSFDVFMVEGYHRRDIEHLGKKFYTLMKVYKELTDTEKLDEEVEDTYEYIREYSNEQVFIINKGKFEEIKKGFIEERKEYFEKNNLFEQTKAELEKLLE